MVGINFRLCLVSLALLFALSCGAEQERPSQAPAPADVPGKAAAEPPAQETVTEAVSGTTEKAGLPEKARLLEKTALVEAPEFPFVLRVKSGPPDAKIFLDGEELGALTSAAG